MSGIGSLLCCFSMLIAGMQATPVSECETAASSASMLQTDVVRDKTTTKHVNIDMKSSSFTKEQIGELIAKLRGDSSQIAGLFAADACMLIIGAPAGAGIQSDASGASQMCGHDAIHAFFGKFKDDKDKITSTVVVSQNTVFIRDCDSNGFAADDLATLDTDMKIKHMTSSNFGKC